MAARRASRPDRPSAWAMATTAGKTTAAGWKTEALWTASCSTTCEEAPFTRAASQGLVVEARSGSSSQGPSRGPVLRAKACRARTGRESLPARAEPIQSTRRSLAISTAGAGTSPQCSPATNSDSARVGDDGPMAPPSDGAPGAHRRDLVRPVADPAEDGVGVLPQRGDVAHGWLHPADVGRGQERLDRAGAGPHRSPAPAGRELGVRHRGLDVVDAAVGDPGAVEPLDDLGRGQAGEGLLDDPGELRAVNDPLAVGGEARVGGQLGPPQHLAAEGGPLALVLQAEDDLAAVAGPVRAVGGDARVRGAGADGRVPAVVAVVEGLGHPLGQRLEHGDLDPGPL